MASLKLLHEWRFNVKLVALLLPLIYFCILQSNSTEYTSNTEYCLSDSHSCNSPHEDYDIGKHEQKLGNLPICQTDSSVTGMCVDSIATYCLYQFRNRYRNLVLEDEIVIVEKNYFEYAIPIIIFTVLGSVCTLFFQSKLLGISFIQDETAFSVYSTEFFIDKFISVCVVVAFSLMIVSSQQFGYMKQEECDDKLKTNHFCYDLNSCDVEIRSIMYPKNWLTREYCVLAIVLALIVFVFEMYCFIFPPEHDEAILLEDGGQRIRQMTIRTVLSTSVRVDDNDSNTHGSAFVYVVQTPRGSMVNRRYMTTSHASPRASQTLSPTRYMQQQQAFKHSHRFMFRRWNFNTDISTLAEDAECAICLELFHDSKKNSIKTEVSTNTAKSLSVERPKVSKSSTVVHPIETDDIDDENDEGEGGTSSLDLQSIVRIPCGHIFHELCCMEWIRENSTCPVCRADTMTGEMASAV